MTKAKVNDPELFAPTPSITEGKAEKGIQVKKRRAPPGAMSKSVVVAEANPPSIREPKSMLQVIAEAVANPACDVEKMRALLEMQERIEANEARKAFTVAFNALQAELPVIDKDGKIDHGDGLTAKGNKKLKTRYATYPHLMEVCGPLLKKHGFTLSNVIEPSADGARINVVGYLEHIGGHSRTTRFPLSVDTTGGKNNQQGWGSAQQYGMRYNAIALLNLVSRAPQDADNDGYKQEEPAAVISEEQAAQLRKAIDDCGVGADRFCEKFGIDSVPQLPAVKFIQALKACDNYAEEKRRAAAKKPAAPASDTFPGDR